MVTLVCGIVGCVGAIVAFLIFCLTDRQNGSRVTWVDLRRSDIMLVSNSLSLPDEADRFYFNSSGSLLSLPQDSGIVTVVETEKMTSYREFNHQMLCSKSIFHPGNPSLLYSVGHDCNLIGWDISGPTTRKTQQISVTTDGDQSINPPFIHDLAFDSDTSRVALGCGDGALRAYRMRGERVATKKSDFFSNPDTHNACIACVCFFPGRAKPVASVGNDKKLVISDARTLRSLEQISIPDKPNDIQPLATANGVAIAVVSSNVLLVFARA